MPEIHRTAIVEPGAELAPDAVVEAYARIGSTAVIGPGCLIRQGAIVERTTLGRGNVIFPYACIGGFPQDKKYKGEDTRLVMGEANVVREHATISIGTVGGGGATRIGDRNLFMASSHIGHDVQVANDCVVANFAGLAGHCRLEDFAIVGGQAGLHQFVRVGASVMISGGSKVGKDIPPFTIAQGYPARLRGVNVIGLTRRGFSDESVRAIKKAYRMIFYGDDGFEGAIAKVREELGAKPEIQTFLKFLEESLASERGFLRPARADENGDEDDIF